MEKINVAELLKYCPKGMELDCTMFDDVKFSHIQNDEAYPIVVTISDTDKEVLTAYGTWNDKPNAKCVIFPKGKTTWKGFQRPFVDGDIVCTNHDSIAILANRIEKHFASFNSYCGLFNDKFDFDIVVTPERLATKEEKAKLFKSIKENGYKWNEETKTLEKLIEPEEPEFKDGDVIVFENHWGPFISIFKENVTRRNGFIGHCVLDVDDNEFKVKDSASYFNKARFATKREKEQLFRAIENNGYKWNNKAKTLEKLVLKFDITTLKPFDKVLVRDFDDVPWEIEFFSRLLDGKHFKCFDLSYVQCIPYEGNEHLLGKKYACSEYFKTWE